MFGSNIKVKIDRSLYDRLTAAAQKAGYATTEEFITHALETHAAAVEEAGDADQVRKQLRGLGYIE